MHWLTGYDGWSFYVHQAVIVPPTGNPIWYGRGQDAAGAQRTAWLPDADIVGYPDHYVQSTERHPMDYLAGVARRARPRDALRTGVEMDNYWFSAAAFASLQRHLPNARFSDATGLVNWQRAVKSPAEIGYMRQAARIVEAMHARIAETARPGIRKCDLVAEIFAAGIRGTAGFGGDYPAIVPLLPSGATPPRRTSPGTTSRCKAGEGTFFEIAGCYHRYHCPLSRTVFLGQADAGVPRRRDGDARGHGGGPRRGEARQHLRGHRQAPSSRSSRKHGIVKDNRTGYSIGLSYPPDWGERTMSLRPGDRTELKPGMTFHFMTGLWLETMGLEITESILDHRDRGRMPRRRPPQADRDRLTMTLPPSPVTPTIDLDAPGAQHGFLRLPYSRDDSAWGSVMIPIAVLRGGDGPTALLTGGNHGDEYEGPIALFDLARTLDPADLAGAVIIVPALNLPAFRAGTRTSPIDRGNLNRSFPGRPDRHRHPEDRRLRHPRSCSPAPTSSSTSTPAAAPSTSCPSPPPTSSPTRPRRPARRRRRGLRRPLLDADARDRRRRHARHHRRGAGQDLRHHRARRRRHRPRRDRRHRQARRPQPPDPRRHPERRPPTPAPTRWLDMPSGDCFTFAEDAGLLEPLVDLGAPVAAGEPVARIHPATRTGLAPVELRARLAGLLAARHFPGLVQPGDCAAVVAVPL